MPLGINSYVDPGVYIKQKLQPGSVTITADKVFCVVAIAPRTRRASDEAIIRGKVYDETLAVSGSTYQATLASTSDRNRSNAVFYRNDNALGLGDWSITSAALVGAILGAASVDVSSATGKEWLTISMDGKAAVTINMETAVTGAGGTPATATMAEVVDGINYALGNAAGQHYATYGAAYALVASKTGVANNEILTIASPLTTSASDVIITLSMVAADDCASLISGAGWAPAVLTGVQAPTIVQLVTSLYSAADTYTIDYATVDVLVDALTDAVSVTTPLSSILSVGSYPGSSLYTQDTDYEDTGQTLDWVVSGQSQATVTSLNQPYTTLATKTTRFALNGLDPITVTFTSTTAAQCVLDINTALNGSTTYGPQYAHVAVVSGTAVNLLAPNMLPNLPASKGYSSVIEILDGTGVTELFGIASGSLPFETRGVGVRPDFGTVFYCTYDYTRASTDYDLPQRVFNTDELYEYCSPITLANYPRNKLAIAGEIGFANGISQMYVVQINDSTVPGTPTASQVNAAIAVCAEQSAITDIAVIDTAEAQAITLMEHVSNMSSIQEKNYRRGWYGMARSTDVGDPDTPDTFVYRSTVTLQPGTTSSGRGRQILCAPASISRTQVLEDGTEVTLELDGSYLAVANAAKFCSLNNPSAALLGETVTGFLTDSTFETYLQAERYLLAGNGVNVTTLRGGRLELLDPLTTEDGGAGVIEYAEPSSSSQKDAVSRAVEQVLDGNVKGIVPDDLSDFIVDIKVWVSLAIKGMINNGAIAPYRNPDGTTREISLLTDIQAYQDENDPRSFIFKYWFNLKYVAKRFFGEYSVDNPFFDGTV